MAQILVAEADGLIREFIAGILTDFGHEVSVCQDSAEASAFLAVEAIDVLLTDLVLLGGEGARLGDDCAARGVPTITLTGREFRPGQGEQERPTPLLDKPFRFADLQCVVDAVVLRSTSARRGQAARGKRCVAQIPADISAVRNDMAAVASAAAPIPADTTVAADAHTAF